MYEMKVKTPPLAQKRRSWTGRLKDRFKTAAGRTNSNELDNEDDPLFVVASTAYPPAHHLLHSTTTASGADDWTTAWVSHPHLQEGHHAPSVPSLQGSVFVAANFVYDYRQKYGHDPANGWLTGSNGKPSIGSVAARRSTTDWSAARGLFPVQASSSPVFRAQQPQETPANRNRMTEQPPSAVEFRAADVNQNIRQWREFKQLQQASGNSSKVTISHAPVSRCEPVPPPLPLSPPPPLPGGVTVSGGEVDDDHSVKTTVAVDRPGLVVTGERICILTGQDAVKAPAISAERVSLKVEFQRHCPLRRSLSDRARPKMAAPASFHDTTRLTQKSRSRGSLHDLFGLPTTAVAVANHRPPESVYAPAKRRTIVRPTEPPPPPPPPTSSPPSSRSASPVRISLDGQPEPPIAPPRRIYRHSKHEPADRMVSTVVVTGSSSGGSDHDESPPEAAKVSLVGLSPGVTSWGGRPLSGQVVSWTAWSGHASLDESGQPSVTTTTTTTSGTFIRDKSPASRTGGGPSVGEEAKRRPVSRLWPSFSSIGRDRTVQRTQTEPASSPEEHIYEEIDDAAAVLNCKTNPPPIGTNGTKAPSSSGLTRTGRGASFAGASRADILRYLEELRKKHPSGVLSVDGERKSPSAQSPPMTPSLPQLIAGPADDEDDDEMGALLLAMRHNGPNRHSNRSTQSSSSSTQSSGQGSASALSGSTTYQNTLVGGGAGSGGGEIERNDSGVGSETSGTAQRLRRLRRLRSQRQTADKEGINTNVTLAQEDDGIDDEDGDGERNGRRLVHHGEIAPTPTTPNWCVDCDQPIETDSDDDDGIERLVCHRCARRRCERREVLAELLETEVRYGRDLRVLQDELYKPLLVAGLVPLRQLDAVFLNVPELANQSQRFGQRLREAVEIALEQGDEDLLTVDVARLFLDKETEEMMDAFRRYCVRSGEASLLLSSLEKERELLRIFLRASQLENPALRRMDLHAFLMVPVQRITKYPLLLGRLLRATAQQDVEMREALREAQAKVESYLTAINAEAKELGSASRPWRRGYSVPNLNLNVNVTAGPTGSVQRPSGEELMNLRLRKMAVDCLGWPENGAVQLVLEGHVKLTQPGELLLTTTRSRGRTLKWQNVWMALVVLNHGQDKGADFELAPPPPETSRLLFGLKHSVQEAAVVLVKDVKNPRPGPSLFRDPLLLSQCTVSCEMEELPNFFEIHHMVTKESFICQTADAAQTQQWLNRLRSLSLSLGRWKQRRNALPHVMMIAN